MDGRGHTAAITDITVSQARRREPCNAMAHVLKQINQASLKPMRPNETGLTGLEFSMVNQSIIRCFLDAPNLIFDQLLAAG